MVEISSRVTKHPWLAQRERNSPLGDANRKRLPLPSAWKVNRVLLSLASGLGMRVLLVTSVALCITM